MSEKDNNGAHKLDLGLSEILNPQDTAADSAQEKLSDEFEETKIFTLDDSSGHLKHEFLSLAESKQWGVLVSKAEAAIAADDDVEARLWWLRGHLGAFSLPVSLLAAPFEAVCRQIGDSRSPSPQISLVREIGDLILERLRDVGDKRQEYAVRVALHNLGLGEVREEKFGSRGKIPPLAPSFDKETRVTSQALPSEPPVEIVRQGTNRRLRLALLVGSLLMFAVVVVWRWPIGETSVGPAPESFVSADHIPELKAPTVRAREVVGALGALFYSISEGSKNHTADNSKTVPLQNQAPSRVSPTASARDSQRESIMAPIDQKAPNTTTPAAVATVNTTGPAEGPEFRKGTQTRPADRARLPDSVGDRPSESRSADSSYPDGALKLPENLKSIIVRTDVMASPSYQARVIGSLERGDRVSVEGRVGQWLRIRSRKGRAGFVFAQDIGEDEDFRAGQ